MTCLPQKVKAIAVIPAFNEEGSIGAVIDDIREHCPWISIVVIDDASEDGTRRVVHEKGELVVTLPVNLGIGGAVQTGLRYAWTSGFDIAIQIDGDGQHPASEIPRLLDLIVADVADVVIGSRYRDVRSFRSSLPRRAGIRFLNSVIRILTGMEVTDATSGFRACNRHALGFLARYYPQDFPEPESIIELYRNQIRVCEVPVAMREREHGESSIGPLKSVYYMSKVLLASVIAWTRQPVRMKR